LNIGESRPRFLVGFFIGGIPQVTTLYAEYLPTKTRGKAILVLSFFWAIGASFEALLALITMGSNLGWRYLVGFSSMPLLVFLLFSNYLPESPMYLAVTGQKDMVERQLNKVYSSILTCFFYSLFIVDRQSLSTFRSPS
jgi:hypothetical protein